MRSYNRQQGFGIWAVRWSADGRDLLVGAADYALHIYDVSRGQVLAPAPFTGGIHVHAERAEGLILTHLYVHVLCCPNSDYAFHVYDDSLGQAPDPAPALAPASPSIGFARLRGASVCMQRARMGLTLTHLYVPILCCPNSEWWAVLHATRLPHRPRPGDHALRGSSFHADHSDQWVIQITQQRSEAIHASCSGVCFLEAPRASEAPQRALPPALDTSVGAATAVLSASSGRERPVLGPGSASSDVAVVGSAG